MKSRDNFCHLPTLKATYDYNTFIALCLDITNSMLLYYIENKTSLEEIEKIQKISNSEGFKKYCQIKITFLYSHFHDYHLCIEDLILWERLFENVWFNFYFNLLVAYCAIQQIDLLNPLSNMLNGSFTSTNERNNDGMFQRSIPSEFSVPEEGGSEYATTESTYKSDTRMGVKMYAVNKIVNFKETQTWVNAFEPLFILSISM